MEIKLEDMDVVDANICFSREYLTKARASRDKDRMLKLLVMANQAISNAINQIDGNVTINDKLSTLKNKCE